MRRQLFLWGIASAASLLAGAGRASTAASSQAPVDDAARERFLREGDLAGGDQRFHVVGLMPEQAGIPEAHRAIAPVHAVETLHGGVRISVGQVEKAERRQCLRRLPRPCG